MGTVYSKNESKGTLLGYCGIFKATQIQEYGKCGKSVDKSD